MVILEGPRLSNAKMRKIRKERVIQPNKRKLSDDDAVMLATTAKYSTGIAVSFLILVSAILTSSVYVGCTQAPEPIPTQIYS
jgi:hypothetical protein